ncbi:MAG TPA: methyltransferase domain-containing protein [Actinomycetota bacterium]
MTTGERAHDTHRHGMHEHGSPLGFTGERVLPDRPEWAWCFQAHKFGYDDLLARIGQGDRVADVGCGEGYGAAQLATKASFVVACDYAEDAVAHARSTYGSDRVAWLVCDAQRLPFAPGSFDAVSSLQVIEHFTDTDEHLGGIARALKPDGWHYVATPNIDQMGPEEADNEFHLRDFTASALREALGRHFGDVELLGMFYVESSPRVRAMRAAEAGQDRVRPKLERLERLLAKLPGPVRVRLRPVARRLMGIPVVDLDAALNAILAQDFEARAPAEESFCLIGVARAPRPRAG